MTQFVLQLWTDDDGIILHAADFEYLREISIALESATTWSDFESKLPSGEFESLNLWHTNDGYNIYEKDGDYYFVDPDDTAEFWRDLGEDYVIHASDTFDSLDVPGTMDGDYPPWLYSTADDVLPDNFVSEFGIPVASMVSGSWIQYPIEQFEQMRHFLEKYGHTIDAHLTYEMNED